MSLLTANEKSSGAKRARGWFVQQSFQKREVSPFCTWGLARLLKSGRSLLSYISEVTFHHVYIIACSWILLRSEKKMK